jgi:hypothetical protein
VEAQPPEGAPPPRDESSLAHEVENPVSKLSSIPVRYQNDFGIGPNDLARSTISIRPTIALPLTRDLSLVSRTTVPFIVQPDVTRAGAYKSGLGDTAESLFFVPPPAAGVIVGVGPSVALPTASASEFGSGQLGVGPAAAVLMQPGPLTLGVLVVQLWSVAGESNRPGVNRMSVLYVAAAHLPGGWYIDTAPVISANWNADSPRNTWTVPIGGGAGKVLRIGGIPINVSVAAYWNAIRPDTLAAPSGNAQVQVALLLPR